MKGQYILKLETLISIANKLYITEAILILVCACFEFNDFHLTLQNITHSKNDIYILK